MSALLGNINISSRALLETPALLCSLQSDAEEKAIVFPLCWDVLFFPSPRIV